MYGCLRHLLRAAGLALLLCATATLCVRVASAHPLAPSLLELRERDGGRFDVLWRQPLLMPRGLASEAVRLPESCRALAGVDVRNAPRGVESSWTVDCGEAGLVGRALVIDGLVAPASAVVRVVFADGTSIDGLVTANAARFDVPEAPSRTAVARSYVRLGLEHIASGADHLLFVFGLVLLASTWRRLIATVTAFTVGHSVTLALATFGLVRVPARPVELLIALSVLWVAIEVARRERAQKATGPEPWTMAGGFGLLHGLGFASALGGAGLGVGALVLGLFAFNVGIELGQLAFVLLVLALSRPTRRLLPLLPAWTTRVPLYAMGTLAAYWCFDRAAMWWAR